MGNCFTWAKKIVLLFMQYGVLIYEDNVKLRLSLAQLLAEDGAFTVAGAFNHCDNVVEEMIALAPALIVMDIDMPGIGGIKGVKQAKEIFPEVKIIMHTVFDDDSRIFESICAGADGYLLKNINPVKFIDELKRVMEGDVAMSPFVAQKVFLHFRNLSPSAKDPYNLTNRELEILQLLVQGNSYKMIADKCSISLDTVKKHLQNIYGKLHVNCGTEAVAKALKHKIVLGIS
jgi:DNA-binding NarL/FixJ family response regulator